MSFLRDIVSLKSKDVKGKGDRRTENRGRERVGLKERIKETEKEKNNLVKKWEVMRERYGSKLKEEKTREKMTNIKKCERKRGGGG